MVKTTWHILQPMRCSQNSVLQCRNVCWKFQTTLTPPCIFGMLRGTFFKPYFTKTKVPNFFLILVTLPHFSLKLSKPKKKSSSTCLEVGHPPISRKIPNSSRKVPQNVSNLVTPPPLSSKSPNSSRKVPQQIWICIKKFQTQTTTKSSLKSADLEITPPPFWTFFNNKKT